MNLDISVKLLLKNINDEITIREKAMEEYTYKYEIAKKEAEELRPFYKLTPKYRRNFWGRLVEVERDIVLDHYFCLPPKNHIPLHLIKVYEYMSSGGKDYGDLKWYANSITGKAPLGTEKLKKYKKLCEMMLDTPIDNVFTEYKILSIHEIEYLNIFSE